MSQTVVKEFSSELEVKKSTFISFLVPIKSFDSLHVELKKEYPKANHIVWAKRYLNEYEQVVENCSDDGEPKGTSGPPVLNVMRGNELLECGILIVRYFGGTKLGTGGLVRAYGGSAKAVIANATLEKYIKKEPFKFSTIYSLVPRFEHFLDKEELHVDKREYETVSIVWYMNLSKQEQTLFLEFATAFERDGFKVL
ncbi:MAG TPA: YigZ family protein [Sulfurospirillum arcachonense]|nr:YigZ family protein [Sulfurospirillum arcachonense]